MRLRDAHRIAVSVTVAALTVVACHRGSSPSPSPLPVGYGGEWQGPAIRFSVSAADVVTSITIVYGISAECSGTLTYTNLAVGDVPLIVEN